MSLNIVREIKGKVYLLKIFGWMDYSTIDGFQPDVPEAAKEVIVDFNGVDFIDSTGIGAVLSILYECRDRGIWMEFTGLSDVARDVFDTIGVFKIRDTLLKAGK